jgi:hypothetical protein
MPASSCFSGVEAYLSFLPYLKLPILNLSYWAQK